MNHLLTLIEIIQIHIQFNQIEIHYHEIEVSHFIIEPTRINPLDYIFIHIIYLHNFLILIKYLFKVVLIFML